MQQFFPLYSCGYFRAAYIRVCVYLLLDMVAVYTVLSVLVPEWKNAFVTEASIN